MSTSKLTPPDLPTPTAPAALAATATETAISVAETGRAVSFWTATGLPFVYLPLILGGLATDHPLTMGALLTLNAITLLIGHGHEPRA